MVVTGSACALKIELVKRFRQERSRNNDHAGERLSLRIYGAGIETIELLVNSQGTSAELTEFLDEGDGRHRSSVRQWVVDRWSDDVFREGLTREEAVGVISTLSGREVYPWLVWRYGWSPERYET